jgi:hypothetical protein
VGKYSTNGSAEFDALVDRQLKIIADEAWTSSYSKHWKALVLCGSYGRGDGTPVADNGSQERPFDGYELVLVTGRLTGLIRGAVQILQERMTAGLNLPVRISPLLVKDIRAGECSLDNYELKHGHRVIRGDDRVLKRMPDYRPEDIPLAAGTRRLMNSGCRLLEIKQRLSTGAPLCSAERRRFVRSILDANLAFGDCILLMRKSYSLSLAEKKEQLKTADLSGLYDARGIANAYSQTVDFIQSGDFKAYETVNLHIWLDETARNFRNVFLWYERRRLNRKFSEIKRYAHAFPNLGNEGAPLKNLAANLRAFGIRGLSTPFVHPRLRLYVATLLLLAEQVDPDALRWILLSYQGTFEGLYTGFCALQKHAA